MIFEVSTVNLINILFIAAGVGICGLNLLEVRSLKHFDEKLKSWFQMFFGTIIIYITMHLARQLMDGMSGSGVTIALKTVTFIEVLSAVFIAYMMSRIVLQTAMPDDDTKKLLLIMQVLVGVHTALLVGGIFGDFIYYFDAQNVYNRGSLYILSNLCPLAMLSIDVFVLLHCRRSLSRRIKIAFWSYILAPIAAIVIQSFSYGIQFIILATVSAAVFMFLAIIGDQNEKYERQRAESSRIETELSLASNIQADMLPNIFPAFPERGEFDIYGSMTPAKEVGGDFYDFFLIDDDHLGLVMADVSGKGVPAALFMMISKILVQNYAMTGRSPKEVLEAVNTQICANNREEMFVTVWFGILDLESGKLTAANAGHEYPALKQPDGSFELIKDKHGFVIGGMEGMKYREYELRLEKGAMLFLYTDGVAEATNANDELFGTDRMIAALRQGEKGFPRDVVQSVDRAVAEFVKDAPQFDDLTMLCLHFIGKK
ncbi:MAG: serine/threonine-protein phosphatase [Ruminococcus sp.]|nr:serine/threonine-protein phosphatase [Ruminococcus sp.]